MKEIRGFIGNPMLGVYVPEGGLEIYRLNAKGRLVKIPQFINSLSGYKMFEHRGRFYHVHQVIFKTLKPEEHAAGVQLNMEIDHKDNNKDNNAIDNLRMLTHAENARNTVGTNRSRRVVGHNSTTFETRIFNSITDTARYLGCSEATVSMYLNRKSECMGWRLTTTSATHRYVYFLDNVPVDGMKPICEAVGRSYSFLIRLMCNPEYGNKIDIAGHTIERKRVKQEDLKVQQQTAHYEVVKPYII